MRIPLEFFHYGISDVFSLRGLNRDLWSKSRRTTQVELVYSV